MARTLDQKIAEAEAKLARLRTRSRQLDTGQKIVLGGMLLNAARRDQRIRAWLLQEAARSVTREADKQRLQPVLDELENIADTRGVVDTSRPHS